MQRAYIDVTTVSDADTGVGEKIHIRLIPCIRVQDLQGSVLDSS